MQSRQPLQNPILVLWSTQEKRGPGRFHQHRPLPPHCPFPLFFVAEFVPLLFVLPASPSAPSSSTNERDNLLYAVSGLFFLCGRSSGREPVCFPLRLFRRVDGHKGSWDLEQSVLVKHVARITWRYQKTFQAGAWCGFSIKMELWRWFNFIFLFLSRILLLFCYYYSTWSQRKK